LSRANVRLDDQPIKTNRGSITIVRFTYFRFASNNNT